MRAVAFLLGAAPTFGLLLLLTSGRWVVACGVAAAACGGVLAISPSGVLASVGRGLGGLLLTPLLLPLGVLALALRIAVAVAPAALGLWTFTGLRSVAGTGAAVLFALFFIAAWIAARRVHQRAISAVESALLAPLRPVVKPMIDFFMSLDRRLGEFGRKLED